MGADVQGTIERAVRAALSPVSIERIVVEQGHDNADEEALFVTVALAADQQMLGGDKLLDAMTEVSGALLDVGDPRFPYVRFDYAGEEPADEGDEQGEVRS